MRMTTCRDFIGNPYGILYRVNGYVNLLGERSNNVFAYVIKLLMFLDKYKVSART